MLTEAMTVAIVWDPCNRKAQAYVSQGHSPQTRRLAMCLNTIESGTGGAAMSRTESGGGGGLMGRYRGEVPWREEIIQHDER